MKKIGIIFLIIVLIILVIVLSNVLIYAIQKGENFMMWNIGEVERISSNIRKDEKIEIFDIENLIINTKSSNVKLILTDDEQVRVIQYSNKEIKEEQMVKINKNDKDLKISSQEKSFGIFLFNLNSIAYDIYIPKNYKSNLKIETASADIDFEDELELKNVQFLAASGDIRGAKKIIAEKIDIELASGNINFNEIDSKDVKLKSVSGEININDKIKAEKADIKTISGDIKIANIESDNIKIEAISGSIETEKIIGNVDMKSTSGDVQIESLKGKISLDTTSGDISVNDFTILNESSVHSISGNIKMFLNKESNCNINTKTVSGNVNLPEDKNIIGNEPYNILKLETTSGNINIK